MCWKMRQIAARPRRVTGRFTLETDDRTTALKPNIKTFIRAVEVGADLTPYLSTKAHFHGYVLTAEP